MSAYNTLAVAFPCQVYGKPYTRDLQFKYGICQQFNYILGDPIIWNAGNEKGQYLAGCCATEGYDGEPCPFCQHTDETLLIYMLDGVIFGVGDSTLGDNDYAYYQVRPFAEGGLKRIG